MSFLLPTAIEAIPEIVTAGEQTAESLAETLDLTKTAESSSSTLQKVLTGGSVVAGGFDAYEHYKSQQDQDQANEAITETLRGGHALANYDHPPPVNIPNTNTNPLYNVSPPSVPIKSESSLQSSYQGAGIA